MNTKNILKMLTLAMLLVPACNKGKINNITRPVTAPTLAQTMTTAGMTVKVKYDYDDKQNDEYNYCLFRSNGDSTYSFQSGEGWVGGDEDCAKALVVEGGKLVFKQNLYGTGG